MESRRHVVVACHAWYGDVIGGAFRLATEFAQHLAAAGYRTSYACCADDKQPGTVLHEPQHGVEIFRYRPPQPGLSGLQRLRYHVHQTADLVRRIHHENPVHLLSSHSPLQGLGAAKALTGQGVFINYTVHSPFDDELLSNVGAGRPSLMQRLAGRVARWVDYRNVVLADRVQTDSRYTLQNFERKHGKALKSKSVVAPGWVEADRFQPATDRRTLRSRLGGAWDTDRPLLFTLRRLESRMGLDTLIQACARVATEGLRFRALIGGGGALQQTLQEMIDAAGLQEQVRLLGRLPEEQLADAYAAADCFVLPTRALECFGLIVLEAFACDTPVIASAAAAIPELAEQQGTDWMFEPGNVDQLSDRLRAFLTGRLKSTVNLRNVAVNYDKPKVLGQWEELLVGSRQSSVVRNRTTFPS